MRVHFLPVLLAVCALFVHGEEQEAKSPKEYARIFAEMLKAFDKPTVKIYRIDPKESAPKKGEKSIGGYLVLEEKAFAQEDLVQLKGALTNEEMYSNAFAGVLRTRAGVLDQARG